MSTAAACGQTLDGVTIVGLQDGPDRSRRSDALPDDSARAAIVGGYAGVAGPRPWYLVTFVAAKGTYAAVVDGRGTRGCVGWADGPAQGEKAVTFGISADRYEQSRSGFCLPFTLRLENGREVRVQARNAVWPHGVKGKSEDARTLEFDGVRPILVHAPLVERPRWDAPPFARHALYGVPLGPVREHDEAPQIRIRKDRAVDQVEVRFETLPGRTYGGRIDGRAVPAEMTGWPDTALIAMWSSERLQGEAAGSDAFNAGYIERLGEPTLARNDDARYGGQADGMWWLYDRQGHLLEADDAAADNCLATFDLWHDNTLWTFNEDLGPWGCSLVRFMRHNAGNYPTVAAADAEKGGKRAADNPMLLQSLIKQPERPAGGIPVTEVRDEVVAGDAMALRHFTVRLGELDAERHKAGLDPQE